MPFAGSVLDIERTQETGAAQILWEKVFKFGIL